jgi:hypothetical protein
VDALQGNAPGRTPVVLVGSADFNPAQRGNQSSAPVAITTFLATKFPVFFIDEYNTSKLCPKCFQELKVVRNTRNRHWICKNVLCRSVPDHDFLVHKDKSAAINMFLCFLSMLMCGKRPKQFRRPERKKSSGGDDDPGGGGGADGGDDGGDSNNAGGSGKFKRKRKDSNNAVGRRKRKDSNNISGGGGDTGMVVNASARPQRRKV